MIVTSSLVNELFRGFHIQRWNDRVRPMELIEMDKHAHKMVIAWCLGKYEEMKGNYVDWNLIIKESIYELLRRIIISDIKSTIFREIKKNKDVFQKLNKYVYGELEAKIEDETIKAELEEFLLNEHDRTVLSRRILDAAHIYSSFWEFQIVKTANPSSFQNIKIEADLLNDLKAYDDLDGINKLTLSHTISNFIDIAGQLRFQYRWAQTPRVPQTSVLGHCMMVAVISYFFTRDLPNCPKRIYNNFFGGIFHDLPESVTRDIISPVKKSSKEFDELLSQIEIELAEKEIFPNVEKEWVQELKFFSQNEFVNKAAVSGIVLTDLSIDEISNKYNSDIFSPYDGELVRAADHLSAFLEAWNSINYGIKSEDLTQASQNIFDAYRKKSLGSIPLKHLYSQFKPLM